ncbi:hypothetical protein [Nocardia sp. NBC_01329]|uniref:hypothetical protein n=1 Tax=Nocardia sp. NBC_01329 TaxID=2903594 RepID=UPI002E0DD9E3|nr:hypothetical protein OG405_06100 [Nocardia sp. NBC_01329]
MNSTVIPAARRTGRPSARWAARLLSAALLTGAAGCGGGEAAAPPDLSAPPTNVRWLPFQGVSLPHTDQGPTAETDGAATGFEHTPTGAGVAAVVHAVRLSIADDGQWSNIAAREVVPGPAKDEWAVNRVQLSISGPADPVYAPRMLGYRITEYSDQRAVVDVYTEYSDSSKAVNHTIVEWFAQDWRLRLPDPQSTTRPIDPISELPSETVKLEAPK